MSVVLDKKNFKKSKQRDSFFKYRLDSFISLYLLKQDKAYCIMSNLPGSFNPIKVVWSIYFNSTIMTYENIDSHNKDPRKAILKKYIYIVFCD